MPLSDEYDAWEEEEEVDYNELSWNVNEDGFDGTMEALKRACLIIGTDIKPNPDQSCGQQPTLHLDATAATVSEAPEDSVNDGDLGLLRSIRSRFAALEDVCEPLSMKPRRTPPFASDEDAEAETLLVIQKRFFSYSTNGKSEFSLELRFYWAMD